MIGSRYFLILFLLIVAFEPFALPSPLRGEGPSEGPVGFQAQKETPPEDPVGTSSGTSNPAGITPGPDSAPEQRSTMSDGVNIEERWGIQILNIRLTADSHMLDFRYRVVDEQKAAPLFSPKIKPLLVDENTGAVMAVPNVPKVGSMRSTRKPVRDRTYFMLFANPQKHIQPGHKVTVVIGDCRVEHLVVE